ncbi:MAG: SpoIIE family protein phosphatase [Oscillatoriales cyanobacterium RM2_1_1]|nr:SpoIIE family protein phosphatase [Oscillatoriales cyanobacterium SM2_3_0]NJO46827.1 SpoIIE family protein phosphatase [Oscillatoriales cyanobacterium RM2_1_1]
MDDMPRYSLWAVGEGTGALSSTPLVASRYVSSAQHQHLIIDTQPENPPEMPDEIPGEMLPYLKLFPYRLHIPVVYGVIPAAHIPQKKALWLLEQGGINARGNLLPKLSEVWKGATAMRQLTWLWQIAQLWYPFDCEQVVSSLLNPELIRVDGSIIRLLELQPDWQSATLAQLGQLWSSWVSAAHGRIRNFLQQLTQQMIAEEIRSSEQLLLQLDQALVICSRAFERKVEIATGTDTGPTRTQNEDACYPADRAVLSVPGNSPSLAIVCDGIGGQEGGEIASQLAIEILQEEISKLSLHPADLDARSLMPKLSQIVSVANNAICSRNDQESRQGRERMGTTMVLALAQGHEIYVAHIGDSRAYWITRTGCRQITLDDDVASREVRLGYAVYRDALQPRSAGALIQALGITPSSNLYPTIQRLPLEEDSIFLLCSDGLSDREQVDQHWQAEILPVLEGEMDLATARNRLIYIANTQNGHDNVTVALIHFRIVEKAGSKLLPEISIAPVIPVSETTTEEDTLDPAIDTEDSDSPTEFVDTAIKAKQNIGLLALGLALLLGLGGLLLYVTRRNQNQPPPVVVASPTASTEFPVELKAVVQLGKSADNQSPTQLLKEFDKPFIKGVILPGSIVQVLEKQSTPQAGIWLEMKVCVIPLPQSVPPGTSSTNQSNAFEGKTSNTPTPVTVATPASPEASALNPLDDPVADLQPVQSQNSPPAIPTLQPGDIGWIRGEDILGKLQKEVQIAPGQRGACEN